MREQDVSSCKEISRGTKPEQVDGVVEASPLAEADMGR